MGKVTRVKILKCGKQDETFGVACNQPKGHTGRHCYTEGPDLQFSWDQVDEPDVPEYGSDYEEGMMFGYANLAGDCW